MKMQRFLIYNPPTEVKSPLNLGGLLLNFCPEFYSISCPATVPLKTEEYQRKRGLKQGKTLWGFIGYKNTSRFPVSCL